MSVSQSVTPDLPLWTPSPERIAATQMTAFRRRAETLTGATMPDTPALHAWSIADPGAFWTLVWEQGGVIGERGDRAVIDIDRMPGATFFPDAKLNFAENLLRRRDGREAIVFAGEDGTRIRLTWRDLAGLVSRLQQAMRAAGVGIGDRVAALMPNRPETIAIMLAATSIGAVFSSCSPDFGDRGVLDRFGQIAPVMLFAVDGYHYAGKRIALRDKLAAIVPGLPSVRRTVIVDGLGDAEAVAQALPGAASWNALLEPYTARHPDFLRLPFDQPVFILFSSGTTGAPKCIVHGAGGTLLQHLKEHRLHADVRPDDRVFYFTTCGWMMWNWLASMLASEATLILFDGSPFHPAPGVLFDLAVRERVTLFGTSAKYLDTALKSGLAPRASHDLSALRMMASTGSPLSPEGYRWAYEKVKPDMHLASISGGTDIVSCFLLGDPTAPVWPGEIQSPGLGLAVEVWDDDGVPLRGEKGELVCTRPFPSMPIGFWNDPGEARYRAAYFERFPNVWHHGDFVERTPRGGLVVHGRSDATLNPGGVRIGTAEIYAQVDKIPEVRESLAIGQDIANDVRIVLFVCLKDGVVLDEALRARIKAQVRNGASPRHVPAKVVQVADIPRTKSGKIVELAVRDLVAGRTVKNRESLANPEALDLFRDLPELADAL